MNLVDIRPQQNLVDVRPQRMGTAAETPETNCSAQICEYVDRLGKLYNRCLMVADDLPCGSEFETAGTHPDRELVKLLAEKISNLNQQIGDRL